MATVNITNFTITHTAANADFVLEYDVNYDDFDRLTDIGYTESWYLIGDDTGQVAVTSTKSMTGHLLGGAGAVESIAAILALHHRVAPPTINVDDLDDDVDLDVISGQPRALGDGPLAALNNSFGFGGHNVALAFRSV